MGRGLSPLQHDIIAALKRQGWSRPKYIFEASGRKPTPSSRSAMSRALARLCERGLVEQAHGAVANPGKSYLYRLKRSAA